MQSRIRYLLVTAATLLVAACGNGSSDAPRPAPLPDPGAAAPPTATFAVTVTNLTNAQPLSPVGVVAHFDGYAVFNVGAPASAGLEDLAEGGSNAAFLAEADGSADVAGTASGAGPIPPAGSETIMLEAEVPGTSLTRLRISTSSMLVNTNDAITVLNGISVAGMVVGDVVRARTIAYDAGTEANSEEAIHIPGPAGGGEGFNPVRDDLADRVAMHPGVVGQDDGFATSNLNNQHKFDNPVAMVRIERIN